MNAKLRRGGGSWFAYIRSDSWWWTSAPMGIAMGYRTSMKGWDTCLTLWYLLVNVLTPRLVIINWTICKQSARGYCCAKVIVIEVRWHWVNIFCLCCTTRRAHHITSSSPQIPWGLSRMGSWHCVCDRCVWQVVQTQTYIRYLWNKLVYIKWIILPDVSGFPDECCCVEFLSVFSCGFRLSFSRWLISSFRRYYISPSSNFLVFVDVEQVCSWNTLSSSSRIPISMQKCRHQ